MSKATEAKAQPINPRTSAWLDQARAIVAYPEDFGMTRHDIRGLQHLLQAMQGPQAKHPVLRVA